MSDFHQSSSNANVLARLHPRLDSLAHTPGVPVIVLRAFLGVTFVFAGLQKLANPNFFNTSSPSSFQAQLRGAMTSSPIHGLLSLVNHAPVVIAVLVACGEVAVGIGTLLGLLGRLAALGGALLSLSFFLTISYSSSPYYYGSDIVFVFAWTPLLLGGSGTYSLDELLRRRSRVASVDGSTMVVGVMDRRSAMRELGAVGLSGVGTAALIGLVAGIGRSQSHAAVATTTPTSPSPSTTQAPSSGGSTTVTTAPSGTKIAAASAIAVGSAVSFTDTQENIPGFLVHPDASTFVAFSAICTHAGCTVGFERTNLEFACPCHGSTFDAKTGAVLTGPATSPLPSIPVTERDGTYYTAQ